MSNFYLIKFLNLFCRWSSHPLCGGLLSSLTPSVLQLRQKTHCSYIFLGGDQRLIPAWTLRVPTVHWKPHKSWATHTGLYCTNFMEHTTGPNRPSCFLVGINTMVLSCHVVCKERQKLAVDFTKVNGEKTRLFF